MSFSHLIVGQEALCPGVWALLSSSLPLLHRGTKAVVVLTAKGESPTVEGHADDEFVFRAPEIYPELESVVLCGNCCVLKMR